MKKSTRIAIFGISMCLLGISAGYLFYPADTDKRELAVGQLRSAAPQKSVAGDKSAASAGKYNGPPCMDESKVGPGQPKPYCGSLPSLAAVNIREAKLEKITDGLKHPWAFEFINDKELLITEFAGSLKHFYTDTGEITDVSGLPEIVSGKGQAGLLDVALHPKFEQNNRIYFSYAIGDGNGRYALAVATAELHGDNLTGVKQIFVGLPYGKSTSNFGGALLFDADGYLLIATGDRSIRSHAQHPGFLTGKIIRLNEEGGVPDNNPFVGKEGGFDPAIYALGVRNPQGLVLDTLSGKIYETEHGPMGGDEVNVIEAGKNYGWPIITYGLNYTYKLIGEGYEKEGLEQPLFYYLPSIAVSPIEIYRGEMFRQWGGDLLVGALKGTAISKLDLVDGRIQSQYQILGELGERVRDIKVAPDSSIWVLLESGAIYRLSRAANPVQEEAKVGQRSGEYIYLSVCSSCHSQNTPGAPQISNKSDWTDRLQKDRKALYESAINGFNGMPEKGFCDDCTDNEVIRAVNFMTSQVNQ